MLRDAGHAGLVVVLDEVETLQRVRGDVRERGLNALRQWMDEVDSGRFPGLYLLVTGTPAFFDGPQGVQRLPPLAQRLHTDFTTDARFDNPRAVQIRLGGRRAYVEPGDLPGRSRWLGSGQPMPFELAQAVRHVLLHGVEDRFLSRRAAQKLGELREEFAWLSPTSTTLQLGDAEGHSRWWTFAGERYNAAAATELTRRGFPAAVDALAVSIRSAAAALPEAVGEAGRAVADEPQPDFAVADPLPLKFIECVPPALRAAMHARRNAPAGEARRVRAAPLSTRVLR